MGTLSDDFYLTDIAFVDDFVVTPSGDIELISGLDNLKQALLNRLVTTKGTLIHRPDYGVGIKDFQNALNSSANKAEIFTRVREQFARDPRVDSVSGIAFRINDTTPELTEVIVSVKPKGYDEQSMTFIPFGDTV